MNNSYPGFDYDKSGQSYSGNRQTDPVIAEQLLSALGKSKTILNVGAGSGSYEPDDRYVLAVEPSEVMRAQRIKLGRAPAIIASAEKLPFDDDAFDASMALLSVHHWPDIRKGLLELKRVSRSKVIVMTFDRWKLGSFWNAEYFPELIDVEHNRYPELDLIIEALGGNCEIIPLHVPLNCKDGFQEAFYGRPESFLLPEVRRSQSAWSYLSHGLEEQMINKLKDDLESGEWDQKHGRYRNLPLLNGAFRLIVANK